MLNKLLFISLTLILSCGGVDGICVNWNGSCNGGCTDGLDYLVPGGPCDTGKIIENTNCEEYCGSLGCVDSIACSYDSSATRNDWYNCAYTDGICETCSGEIDGTGTVVDNDADDDGVCDDDEVAGCAESGACNYNADATDDDGSCAYIDGICDTCEDGVVVDNDADDDGVCDDDENP